MLLLFFGNCTVGTFNKVLQATKYCMIVKDTAVYMDQVSDDLNEERYNNLLYTV